jgi:hypothetical protein
VIRDSERLRRFYANFDTSVMRGEVAEAIETAHKSGGSLAWPDYRRLADAAIDAVIDWYLDD